jgi:hypothetical protein
MIIVIFEGDPSCRPGPLPSTHAGQARLAVAAGRWAHAVNGN